MCVFYDSRFKCYIAWLVAAQANKKRRWETKKPEISNFFCSGTVTSNSFRSLDHVRDNGSIIYFNYLRKPIEI